MLTFLINNCKKVRASSKVVFIKSWELFSKSIKFTIITWIYESQMEIYICFNLKQYYTTRYETDHHMLAEDMWPRTDILIDQIDLDLQCIVM